MEILKMEMFLNLNENSWTLDENSWIQNENS